VSKKVFCNVKITKGIFNFRHTLPGEGYGKRIEENKPFIPNLFTASGSQVWSHFQKPFLDDICNVFVGKALEGGGGNFSCGERNSTERHGDKKAIPTAQAPGSGETRSDKDYRTAGFQGYQ
jgi:hypothetical protein